MINANDQLSPYDVIVIGGGPAETTLAIRHLAQTWVDRFPEHRPELIDCLVGDVVGKNMRPFVGALAEMTAPPLRLK